MHDFLYTCMPISKPHESYFWSYKSVIIDGSHEQSRGTRVFYRSLVHEDASSKMAEACAWAWNIIKSKLEVERKLLGTERTVVEIPLKPTSTTVPFYHCRMKELRKKLKVRQLANSREFFHGLAGLQLHPVTVFLMLQSHTICKTLH